MAIPGCSLGAMSAPPAVTEVALGVVTRAGRVLVQPRHGDPSLSGTWEFPGGRRGSDESLREAVVREVAEETGVAVEAGELLVALSHRYADRTVTLYAYRCRPIGVARLRRGVEWVAPDELRRRRLPAANPPILAVLDWERRRRAPNRGGLPADERYDPEPSPLDRP